MDPLGHVWWDFLYLKKNVARHPLLKETTGGEFRVYEASIRYNRPSIRLL